MIALMGGLQVQWLLDPSPDLVQSTAFGIEGIPNALEGGHRASTITD
jgi:hypothetical protein